MAVDTNTLELKLVRSTDSVAVDLQPLQGIWIEEQYLRLSDQTRHLIEFADGVIEVLPMPTDQHQVILLFLYEVLRDLLKPTGGKVLVAPIRLRVREGMFREPDLLLLLDSADPRRQNRFWLGADLVAEIVSPDDPERDMVIKRNDYAEAGIPEYWIVNPQSHTITVLQLVGDAYTEYGVFQRGDVARSVLLDGLRVGVDDLLDAR